MRELKSMLQTEIHVSQRKLGHGRMELPHGTIKLMNMLQQRQGLWVFGAKKVKTSNILNLATIRIVLSPIPMSFVLFYPKQWP